MATEQNIMPDSKKSQIPERDRLKSDAAEVMEKAKDAGQQRLETGKQTAAEQAEKVAGVVEQASTQFRQSDLQSLADYAGQVGTSIKSLSEDLRNRSIDDLLKDTQALARRNPTIFLLGSVALGVAISRFFKASAERQHESHNSSTRAASGLARESQTSESHEPSIHPTGSEF
jgi:hypothetical protein